MRKYNRSSNDDSFLKNTLKIENKQNLRMNTSPNGTLVQQSIDDVAVKNS